MLPKLRFFQRSKNTPVRPVQIFTSVEAFMAALRGHSEVKRCFAWGQHILEKGRTDCVVYAEAYDTAEYCDRPALFTMVCTVYEAAEWPLSQPLEENLKRIIDSINFHVLCK